MGCTRARRGDMGHAWLPVGRQAPIASVSVFYTSVSSTSFILCPTSARVPVQSLRRLGYAIAFAGSAMHLRFTIV